MKDLESYLKETLVHEILNNDEILGKFLTLNSNDFNNLKAQNNIYDQQTDSSSFLKMPTHGNIKSFYEFYEHAQSYLYTKFNAVIKKKKSYVIIKYNFKNHNFLKQVNEHLDFLIEAINKINIEMKKIYDLLKKISDFNKVLYNFFKFWHR